MFEWNIIAIVVLHNYKIISNKKIQIACVKANLQFKSYTIREYIDQQTRPGFGPLAAVPDTLGSWKSDTYSTECFYAESTVTCAILHGRYPTLPSSLHTMQYSSHFHCMRLYISGVTRLGILRCQPNLFFSSFPSVPFSLRQCILSIYFFNKAILLYANCQFFNPLRCGTNITQWYLSRVDYCFITGHWMNIWSSWVSEAFVVGNSREGGHWFSFTYL